MDMVSYFLEETLVCLMLLSIKSAILTVSHVILPYGKWRSENSLQGRKVNIRDWIFAKILGTGLSRHITYASLFSVIDLYSIENKRKYSVYWN